MDETPIAPTTEMDPQDLIRAAQIHADEPQDYNPVIVDTPPVNSDDFEDADEPVEPAPTSEHTEKDGEEIEDHTSEQEELTDEELEEEKRKSAKAAEVKKRVASLVKPAWVVKFCDRLLSNAGPYVLRRSEPGDWRLDPEDVTLLADLLEVMKEEGEWDFWPTHYWLILALVVIYLLKGQQVYRMRYSQAAIDAEAPKLKLEDQAERHAAQLAEEQYLTNEVEHEERMAKLYERRRAAQRQQEAPKHNPSEGSITSEHLNLAEMLERYPPEVYEWKGKEPVRNRNGTVRKRRGGKQKDQKIYNHPVTGKICTREEWEEATEQIAMNGHQETEEVEAEVVE